MRGAVNGRGGGRAAAAAYASGRVASLALVQPRPTPAAGMAPTARAKRLPGSQAARPGARRSKRRATDPDAAAPNAAAPPTPAPAPPVPLRPPGAATRRPRGCLTAAPGVPERLGDSPLRLVLSGTNPSDEAWRAGHYYAHPTNRFWPILKKVGLAPEAVRGAEDDHLLPALAGIGLCDVGCGHPGTILAAYSTSHFATWVPNYYSRLAAHTSRACASMGCAMGRWRVVLWASVLPSFNPATPHPTPPLQLRMWHLWRPLFRGFHRQASVGGIAQSRRRG